VTRRGMSPAAMAWRAAQDIPDGSYVNLGIGLPTMVAGHLAGAVCHSENGVLGVVPVDGVVDPDLINASKEPVGLRAGGAFFDHATSFAMIRAGYIDLTVMGAFQVSAGGDLANWSTGEAVPAVGGAMDLAAGARRVFVLMRHTTRDGTAKIVETCTYPLTAAGVVERIYTDLAVIRVTPDGLIVEEVAPDISAEELRAYTAASLLIPDGVAPYGRRGEPARLRDV
jgi:3-oxoadipate CoA-transferase beta subunit